MANWWVGTRRTVRYHRERLGLERNSERGRPNKGVSLIADPEPGDRPVIVDGESDWADEEELPQSVVAALVDRNAPIQGPVRPVGNKTIAGVKFPRGGIAETEDLSVLPDLACQ